MATPILMPQFGQMTEVCAIVEWYKKEGDKVAKGDVLFTIETDKSAMDVESFAEGTLLKIVVPAGINVPVQSTVGFLGRPGETIPEVTAPAAAGNSKPGPGTALEKLPPDRHPVPEVAAEDPTTRRAAATVPEPPSGAPAARQKVSPRAAALARDLGVDLAQISGSGPGGRVVENDVRAYMAAGGLGQSHDSPGSKPPGGEVSARPAAGAGAEGASKEWASPAGGEPTDEGQPMSRMRQVIAQRLTKSFRDTPHFYVTVSVDMTDLVAFRAELKVAGTAYTITDFVAQAVVLTLQELPQLNSSTDGQVVWRHRHINLGVTVALEDGLVVPVIRAAERLALSELHQQSRELVERARGGRVTPDDLRGGTFTISNMGMMDVESFGAIINPGESAILAVASVKPQPVVREGRIEVRQLMRLTLSCDHRLVDGALGSRFLNAIKQKLESANLWRRLAV